MQNKNKPRRDFLTQLGTGFLGLALLHGFPFNVLAKHRSKTYRLYIGTYTRGRKEGIFLYHLNAQTGELEKISATEAEEASFLAFDTHKRFLFAVNELMDFDGKNSGAISSFAIDSKSGDLMFINKQASNGGAPCYIASSPKGDFVMAANYMGGNVSVLPVGKNGILAPVAYSKQHEGTGPNKERQEAPHAHCIILDPKGKHAFSADLGADKIYIYKVDSKNKNLLPHDPPFVKTKPGAGPRHISFHPNGKYMYLINELDSTVSAYSYDQKNGQLKELQTLSMLPKGYSGKNQCADLHVSPDGKFLYGSNRGHNSIGVFSIDSASGKLSLVEHVSTMGDWPRNFTIDPSGNILLVGNERSNNVVSFFIDKSTGQLKPTGHVAEVPAPVCLLIAD